MSKSLGWPSAIIHARHIGPLVFRVWPSWMRWRSVVLPCALAKRWPWSRGVLLPWLGACRFYGAPTINIGRFSVSLAKASSR